MRVQLSNMVAAITLLFACDCGSSSDLVIGYQAEANSRPDAAPMHTDASVEPNDEPGDMTDADLDTSPDSNCPLATGPCAALKSRLIHRYSFNGTGTVAFDSVGMANGTVIGTRLNGNGTLILAGGTSNQYVDLPNGMIKVLHDATFEAWVEWNGNGSGGWQRIFDFGDSSGPEGVRNVAGTSLYLTPQSQPVAIASESNVMVGAFKRADQPGNVETRAAAAQPMPTGAMIQVVLVVDETHSVLTLYQDGVVAGTKPFLDTVTMQKESLTTLNDINNWLGLSQYAIDPSFNGTFYEFRIFDAALTANAVRTLFLGGTDPAFLN